MKLSSSSIQFIDQHPHLSDLRSDVEQGLRSKPYSLPPKLFYDEAGSRLFEQITGLDEYYPTRTEISILEGNAGEIVANWGERAALIELGSGSSLKVRILLDALAAPITYMALDISREHLEQSALSIQSDYDGVEVIAVCTDYTAGIDLPGWSSYEKRIFFFPGSTIGNFEPDEAKDFLQRIAQRQSPGDEMIIGVDLHKDKARLEAAYNDESGVTAAFNLNILERLNRELDANFVLSQFAHEAFYDEEHHRIEMHLRSLRDQQVRVGTITIDLAAGETIHTENSYKYSVEGFAELLEGTGFSIDQTWTDEEKLFSVHRLMVVED